MTDILVFGGTTEGKKAAAALDFEKLPYFYSTKIETDFKPSVFCNYIHGDLNEKSLPGFIRKKGIKLIINAAHPFAGRLHQTVALISEKMKIPVIRYERKYPEKINHPLAVYCDDFAGAVREIENQTGGCLILSGVRTLSKLKPLWENRSLCYARILPRETSVNLALKQGFPKNRLITGMPGSDIKKEKKFFEKLKIKSIVTKESGESGGQEIKIKAAIETGAKIAVIKRPEKPVFPFAVKGRKQMIKKIREIHNVP